MIKKLDKYSFVETEGEQDVVILLHGLFGGLSNWTDVINEFGSKYKIYLPILPIETIELKKANVHFLADYIKSFVCDVVKKRVHALIGNSLGGHLALLCVINNLFEVDKLVLTGSSGLYEKPFFSSVFKRHNREFIAKIARQTFFDGNIISEDYINEMFNIIQDNSKILRFLYVARSSQRNIVEKSLDKIKIPTLLIWGKEDTVTPPKSAYQFNELIENSELHLIEQCAHVPMMEQPKIFNDLLRKFL